MRILLNISFLATFLNIWGQAPKEKWGSPSIEELKMATCTFDPMADAAILNNYGHYYFNRHFYSSTQELRVFYHYQVRLKIFTEEGKKYATISIPYRGYDEYEDVVEISGATYNIDGSGKTVKSKFKSKDVKWTRNNGSLWNCTFTLPDVKVGSIIEYSYKIASLDFVKLRDWLFQKDIPVLNSELTFSSPNFYTYAFFSNIGSDKLQIKKEDQVQYLQFYSTNVYCHGTMLKMSARNIPAFRKEVMMPDSSRQILKGEFLLSTALTNPSEFNIFREYYRMIYLKPLLLTTTNNYYEPRNRAGLYNDILAAYKFIEGMDWESFTKKLNKRDDFSKNMLKAFDSKTLIDSFRRIEAGEKRMAEIYNFVKSYMKWNGEYRIFTSNSLEKIFEKRTGYSSDINMLLINLLSRSGIQARPVLISTRSYGNVYKEMGFFRKFNSVIASVELNGKRYLLDATDPLRSYKLLSVDDLNDEGFLVNLLDYQWVSLINSDSSSVYQTAKYELQQGNILQEEIKTVYTGYKALEKRKELLDSTFFPEKQTTENLNNCEEPLRIHKSYTDNLSLKDSLVITPWAENSLIENPFTSENRTHPVDFKYEQTLVRELELIIPQGYKLASFPQSQNLVMQGNFLTSSFSSSVHQDKLRLNLRVDILNSYIPPQFYNELIIFLESIKNIEQEKIILKKLQ